MEYCTGQLHVRVPAQHTTQHSTACTAASKIKPSMQQGSSTLAADVLVSPQPMPANSSKCTSAASTAGPIYAQIFYCHGRTACCYCPDFYLANVGLGVIPARSTAKDVLQLWNVTLAVGRLASFMKHTCTCPAHQDPSVSWSGHHIAALSGCPCRVAYAAGLQLALSDKQCHPCVP
jgi:hypothetical protein